MAWRLAPSRRLLVASPGYLKRQGTPASLAELEGHRGIFYTNRGIGDWRFAGAKGSQTVRARVALRVNNGDMMRDAAIADLGIALLPSFAAADAIAEGKLRVIDLGRPAQDEFIFMAHPEGRRASAKLKALVASLRQAFGNPPYWDRPRAKGAISKKRNCEEMSGSQIRKSM